MKSLKGGAGFEQLILAGVISIAVLFLLISVSGIVERKMLDERTHDTLNSLSITANAVRSLGGEGSGDVVSVRLPSGIEGSSVSGTVISYDTGKEDVSLDLGYPVIGNLPYGRGTHIVSVKSIDGALKVGDWPYVERMSPSCVGQDEMPKIVTLLGYDFSSSDVVLVDGAEELSVYLDGGHIEIAVTNTYPLGGHSVLVENDKGESLDSKVLKIVTLASSC